jgi:hypothetical protein
MEPKKMPIEEHRFVQRVVAVGLVFSVGYFVLLVILPILLMVQERQSHGFFDKPLAFPTVSAISLTLLICYWLAVRYAFFLSNRSGLGVHIPVSVRTAMLWYVIAMSFIFGAVLIFVSMYGGGFWNIWKEDES